MAAKTMTIPVRPLVCGQGVQHALLSCRACAGALRARNRSIGGEEKTLTLKQNKVNQVCRIGIADQSCAFSLTTQETRNST